MLHKLMSALRGQVHDGSSPPSTGSHARGRLHAVCQLQEGQTEGYLQHPSDAEETPPPARSPAEFCTGWGISRTVHVKKQKIRTVSLTFCTNQSVNTNKRDTKTWKRYSSVPQTRGRFICVCPGLGDWVESVPITSLHEGGTWGGQNTHDPPRGINKVHKIK